jgi:hypothetical protein
MKKLGRSATTVCLLILAVNIGQAGAVPDIRGAYSGSYEVVVSNCSNSDDNGTYNAVLIMTIHSQTGNTFNGSATGTFDIDGSTVKEYIQLSGTITQSGQIAGTTTHTFLDSAGEGTFTGQLTGNTLTIENSGQDTSPGHTCTYIRYMSATRIAKEFKIRPSDGAAFDWFGNSVSISGRYAIVGSPVSFAVPNRVGAAYIFERSGSNWNQVAKLTAGDGATFNWFGTSVSISGRYAIVGDSGAAYIFEGSGSSWNQMAKLTASDGASGDFFGYSVSISEGLVIVGAYRDDNNGIISGSAYIFERSGSSWSQVAKLTDSGGGDWDSFGAGVSISGGYAIVGAYGDDDNGNNSGSAYIFERSGSSWNQVAKLTAIDGDSGDFFGYSVSISEGLVIVGAHGDRDNGNDSGAAYIFQRSGSSWNQIAKLTATDGADHDYFSDGVSISSGYAIVGAYGDDDNGNDSGSAYIFDLSIPVDIAMPWIPLLFIDD